MPSTLVAFFGPAARKVATSEFQVKDEKPIKKRRGKDLGPSSSSVLSITNFARPKLVRQDAAIFEDGQEEKGSQQHEDEAHLGAMSGAEGEAEGSA